MNFFKESWRRKLGNVKTTSQGSDNWQQDFLDILGLQSGSVEYYNRLGIGPLVYYMYLKQTPNNADLWLDNQVIQSSQTNASINNLISDADLLFKNTRASMLSWFPFQSRIRNGIVTQDPISEEISLSNDYIAYLSDPSNIEIIIQEYIDQNLYDGSLLYGMLRHSLLLIIWEILWKKFHGEEWIEKELLNTEKDEACKAIWYQFEAKKEELISYISTNSKYISFTSALKKLIIEPPISDPPTAPKSIPTERLERLLSEHLDLCSYRYDAWQTGLVDYKLQKMRTSTPNGCYLGAYGWVLNVRKDPDRTIVPNSQIPTLFSNTDQIHKLTFDEGNAGFIHAPSIAQATTSAVLREGYLSKGKEQMQVDLTSKRVRLAKEIIEGIQNGQELAALLGYRFERSLHDKSGNGLELDKYIYDLRTKYPLVTRNAENLVDFEANNVVHGLDLLKAFRGNPSMFNFSADENHLKNSCEELEEIIDAISDLTMAEGVHQAVMGNHVRANAILNSIGEGKNIPNPEIVETPRTGITLTQRMGVLFNADDINPNIWSNNQTYRSKVSPQINWWIGKILGDGNKKKCKVSYQISKDPDVFESEIVTPIDLGMQPLDFVILLNNPLGDESSELAQRIIYYLRKKNGLLKDVAIKIDYQSRDDFADTDVTFIEILAIVRNIYKLITESEVLLPTHLQRDSEMIQIPENEEFDLASYNGMLNLITLKSDLTSLKLLLEGSNAESNFVNLRAKLFELSELGIQGCISTDPNGYDETARTLLIGTTDIALKELEKRLRQLEEIVRERSLKQAEGIIFSKYKELFKDIKVKVGQDVPILPKFKITNYPEVKLTYHDRENLINHAGSELVMDDWLIGISKVKDKIQNWQTFSLLADISESGVDTKIHTMQLPYQVDDQWMGIEYNKPQEAISPDTTSLVLNFPNNFPSDDAKLVCGFIIDEWIEKIPNRKETTGIAFNYDEPQTEAPQAILLCVPPTNRSNWSWDDLISTLDETLEAAQLRAIDPDLLEKAPGSEFNKFLPGIVHPISSDHKQTVIFNQSV